MAETISDYAKIAPKVYLGLNEQHDVDWIERGWKIQSSPDFPEVYRELHVDDCITEIVAENIKRGNKNITVLDIGSGSEGFFIKSFAEKQQFPKLHNLLENTTGLNLRVVGLTGAKEGDIQGLPITQDEIIKNSNGSDISKISIENYGYTITRFHTLNNFLSDKNIQNINLAFSTFGIGYFTPNNFDQCLVNVADNLAPEGRFYGITWDAVPAGYVRSGFLDMVHLPWINYKKEHPLEVMFVSKSAGEQKQFSDLLSKDQVATYLNAFDFAISKKLVSVEQVKKLFLKNDILPISEFIDKNAIYTTEIQKEKIKKVIAYLAKTYPWINDIDWSKNNGLFDPIQLAFYHAMISNGEYQIGKKHDLFSKFNMFKHQKSHFFDEGKKVKDILFKYIKIKFASSVRNKSIKAKEEFNTKISNLDWLEIKSEIARQNQDMVANFWDWDGITSDFRNILLEQQRSKTTESKVSTIDQLSQREDLKIYSSRIIDRTTNNHGLNILVLKR